MLNLNRGDPVAKATELVARLERQVADAALTVEESRAELGEQTADADGQPPAKAVRKLKGRTGRPRSPTERPQRCPDPPGQGAGRGAAARAEEAAWNRLDELQQRRVKAALKTEAAARELVEAMAALAAFDQQVMVEAPAAVQSIATGSGKFGAGAITVAVMQALGLAGKARGFRFGTAPLHEDLPTLTARVIEGGQALLVRRPTAVAERAA